MYFDDVISVIFDFDGTIADSMDVWRKIDTGFLGKRGIAVPGDLQEEIGGRGFRETAEYFRERFSLKMETEEIMDEWEEMAREYYSEKVELKPFAETLIKKLAGEGIICSIGSSNNRSLIEICLKKWRLSDYFSCIMTSCEAGKGKPHGDLFLKIAEKTGVDPYRCVVIDDIHEGIIAAKRAGMRSVAVYEPGNKKRKLLEKDADKYIMSLCGVSVMKTAAGNKLVFNS